MGDGDIKRMARMGLLIGLALAGRSPAGDGPGLTNITRSPLGLAYASDGVNAAIFRVGAVVTGGQYQFATYYAPDARVVVASRRLGQPNWDLAAQRFSGNVRDAHNVVVLGISSDGLLHLSYDHHGNPLHYRVSAKPYDIRSFGDEQRMTGDLEEHVTYPQFISAPDGTLYFFYRDGASGNGSMCMNRYDVKSKTWKAVRHPLIDGENKCNPYWWRPSIGEEGSVHIAWCWRDSPDASTNHDLCYARSNDGGETWVGSDGKSQALPITPENAEVVAAIGNGSNLMNQCSSAIDHNGHPHLVEYFNDSSGIPQYFDVWFDGHQWKRNQVSHRETGFSLGGGGSLAIPISRPEVAVGKSGTLYVITRDAEAAGGIRMYQARAAPFQKWDVIDLMHEDLGNWEPSFDQTGLNSQGVLSLFVLAVQQGNHEKTTDFPPQRAMVLSVPLP